MTTTTLATTPPRLFWIHMSPAQKERAVREGCAAGLTASQIGAPFGATKNSILSLARRRKIAMAHKPNSQHTERRARKARARPRVARPRVARPVPAPAPAAAPVRPAPFATLPPLPPETWAPRGEPVSFMDLRDDQCRWPVGEAEGSKQMFCGCTVKEGSYCKAHARKSRRPTPPRPAFRGYLREHVGVMPEVSAGEAMAFSLGGRSLKRGQG